MISHLAQSPGQAHGLAAGGTLEIVILFVGLEHLPPPEPPEDGPEQGDKTGIFHLPLLLILENSRMRR